MEDGKPTVMLNCHQNCGMATYVFLDENGDYIPITEFVDVEKFFEVLDKYADDINDGGFGIKKRVLAKAALSLPKLIDKENKPDNLDLSNILLKVFKDRSYHALGDFSKDAMLISCMHFMDPFNFDVDRVKNCVIHYATPDGRIIPFCTMNSLFRDSIEEKFSTPLKSKKE